MKYLGIMQQFNHHGKELHDGACVFVSNGVIEAAYMEERLTRRLRAGGSSNGIEKIYPLIDKDTRIGISSCTESKQSTITPIIKGVSAKAIDHHLSHAFSAFELSGFRESLVIVMDGGGNTLGDNKNWWEVKRQQNSYYIFSKNGYKLIDVDFDNPFDMGFGELFRSMTYLLGFNTSKKAANITSLASYGCYQKISTNRFIYLKEGKLHNICKCDPNNPIESLNPLWSFIGKQFNPVRFGEEITADYCDLCAYVQWNVEQALFEKISYLKRHITVSNLCLAGGVALNCVLNAKLIESKQFQHVFIPFCAGDHGQALGNTIALLKEDDGDLQCPEPYLGTDADDVSFSEISEIIFRLFNNQGCAIYLLKDDDLISFIANLIVNDEVLFVCRGKSEFGLRALGNRSIIARSDSLTSFQKVCKIKEREWYRPFAPMVLESKSKDIIGHHVCNPYMTVAYQLKNRAPVKYCTSVEGRSRIQTVKDESFWGKVLKTIEAKDIFPACLNTSLNKSGEPIVESPEDAIRLFYEKKVNTLVLGNYVLQKKYTNHDSIKFDIIFRIEGKKELVKRGSVDVESIRYLIYQYTGIHNIFIRSYFSLNQVYTKWLQQKKKNTTTRFKENCLEIPIRTTMGIWESQEFEDIDFNKTNTSNKSVDIHIRSIEYVRFGDLTSLDAYNDGFQSLRSMKDAFKTKMYPLITEEDWVTIYHFCLDDDKSVNGQI